MRSVTRRSFVASAAAGMTALGLFGGAEPAAEAQLVWTDSEWKLSEFHALVKNPARIKQLYDVVHINEGKFLNNVKNSLNGLQYGFGIPKEQIKIVAAMHGPANMLNYDDYVWKKYGIGEWLAVTDPATGQAAERNIFYPAAAEENATASSDPDNEHSLYQAKSIQTLQARGVQFLSCHTATEEQARALVRRNKLSQAPEEIVQDMLAHTVPGVLVVASMVAAVALLQAEGHYTYITV
jgi:intracellular sulfur oxidation DsrE/DsrF family protein